MQSPAARPGFFFENQFFPAEYSSSGASRAAGRVVAGKPHEPKTRPARDQFRLSDVHMREWFL
jgi:hypothetical protein